MCRQGQKFEGSVSPDAALVVFTSSDFASIFLVLVISISGHEFADSVTAIPSLTHSAQHQAHFEQLNYMTRLDDEVIEAGRIRMRAVFCSERFLNFLLAPTSLRSRAFSGRAKPPGAGRIF